MGRFRLQLLSTERLMATKKKTTAKKSTAKKSTAKKKSTARKTSAKSTGRKTTAKRATAKKTGGKGALHNVARSIGSTLGSFAKKTSEAVDAAKNALPFGSETEGSEQ
jgi:sorbitol-specific phosphotransferase system component IIBC